MTKLDLGQEPLLEDKYRADLELLDRYTGFSSELVRLASLGLGGLALFLKASLGEKPALDLKTGWFNLLLGGAVLLFGMAVACGLLHRYYAADGFACHIRALRLVQGGGTGVEAEAVARTNRYKLATSWLISSECAVAAGAIVAGVVFAVRFSTLTVRWVPALVLAGMAVVVAIGLACSRWWRTWREAKRRKGKAAQP
jgi:hypothetical protein